MFESYGWVAQAVIWWGEVAQAVIWWGEVAQAVIWWVVLVILVSSPVQSFEIWSSTGLSLDNNAEKCISSQ